jgi:4-hydroxy 2-oxovalerate aldolase
MVSGAYSLPQKDVMEALEINRYSLSGIINSIKKEQNIKLPLFIKDQDFQKAIIIGGGESVKKHLEIIKVFLKVSPTLV